MSDLIVTKDGRPYSTEVAAKMQQGKHREKGIYTRIIQHEGGFALQVIKKSEGRRKGRGNIDKGPLAYDKRQEDPDYVYRIVNDTGMEVRKKEANDWEIDTKVTSFIENDANREVPAEGGLRRHGGYVNGNEFKVVLMRKRKDYFEEDFEEKQAYLDRLEKRTRKEKPGGDQGGFYATDGDGPLTRDTP